MERIQDPGKAKKIINDYGEGAPGWPFREEKADITRTVLLLKNRLVDPVLLTSRLQMPDPIVGFDDARNNNTLAYYNTQFDAYGIPDQIIMNTAQYEYREGRMQWRYGLWSRDEVVLHEMAHGYFNYLSKLEGKKIPAHGIRFCQLLESWGLHPVPGIGSHFQVADLDSPFGRLETELGHARPADVPRDDDKPIKTDWFRPTKDKGRSTLHKWECPTCGFKARVGINDDPQLIHEPCGVKLINADHGVIYKGK